VAHRHQQHLELITINFTTANYHKIHISIIGLLANGIQLTSWKYPLY
jgi:hypothetical protein